MSELPMASRCRLTVDAFGAMLDGSPTALRGLAEVLAGPTDPVLVELAEPGSSISRRRTESDQLTVSVGAGPALLIEGSDGALAIAIGAMRGVADEADEGRSGPVRRHAHIEYLGEGDRWRSPASFPLVIGSDWPEAGAE